MTYMYYEMGQGKKNGLIFFYERNADGILQYLACTSVSNHQSRMKGIDASTLEELTRRALEQSHRRNETIDFTVLLLEPNALSVTADGRYVPR